MIYLEPISINDRGNEGLRLPASSSEAAEVRAQEVLPGTGRVLAWPEENRHQVHLGTQDTVIEYFPLWIKAGAMTPFLSGAKQRIGDFLFR